MPQTAHRHQLSCLIVAACLAAVIVRCQSAEVQSEDALENDWLTFQCDYDQASDRAKYHELGVSVQECSMPTPMVMEPTQFKLVAAVFGRLTASSADMKSKLMNNQDPPMYYANNENAYVKDGLVEIIDGQLNGITIKIKATNRTDRICAACGQTVSSFGYTETKKVSMKVRRPPTIGISLNDNHVAANERRELQRNQAAKIVCTATGPGTLTVKLLRNDKVLASTSDSSSLTHKIAATSRENAGVYKCEASTDMPLLIQRNSHIGSAEFVLAVKFAPEFEVSEIVRYTQVDSQENIKISIPAYPAAELTCDPPQPNELTKQESYDDREFVAQYQLILSNLDNVQKETQFECTARNEVGERKLRILLTAKAPTPEILSNERTAWHNSYELKWQHDQNATIDYYQVEIVYKNDGKPVNSTQTKFNPSAQTGKMALVDGRRESGKIVHSGVLFGLNPDSEHDIRLQSCNKHGCSEFSGPVRVLTPRKSASNYNDPQNPEKMSTKGNASPTLRTSITPVVGSIFCAYLSVRLLHRL